MWRARWLVGLMLGLGLTPWSADAARIRVSGPAELRGALSRLKPGDTLLLAPGEYGNGYSIRGLSGTVKARIVIKGSDPRRPPTFTGGNQALHLIDCNHLTLSNLAVRGCRLNGINIDDGGSFETPSRGIILENVTISEIGPRGNHDGLKLSGVDDFIVRKCRFEGWGGSAIDMVGCHQGVVEDCQFIGKEGYSQSSGVQMKGGTSEILVHSSFFHNAGQRAINLGGSTGLQYFRPKAGKWEASRITVAGNRFVGGVTPIAWVGAEGGVFRQNTVYLPGKWVLRILQENTAPQFAPCRNGVFQQNLIVFDRRVTVFANVGPNTAPGSFKFRRNAWFQVDGRARPRLPAAETEGVYQVDPRLADTDTAKMRKTSRDARLKGIGADSYIRPPKVVAN